MKALISILAIGGVIAALATNSKNRNRMMGMGKSMLKMIKKNPYISRLIAYMMLRRFKLVK